jgi:hypothetical protein
MLKNGKYDSKYKSVLFVFLFYLKKIHQFGYPKHCIIPALPGLDRKKSTSTYCHIAVLLNLKFQLDKLQRRKSNYSFFYKQQINNTKKAY